MLQWEETDGSVKSQAIAISLALVVPFIHHSGGLPVAQLFLRKMVVSPWVIARIITILICRYLTTEIFFLRVLVYAPCLPVH